MAWRVTPGHMAAALTRGDIDLTGAGDDYNPEDLPSTVYRLYPHTALLSKKFREAATGKSRRQIWALPPRYGKSILASQWGPAWFLEMFPHVAEPEGRIHFAGDHTSLIPGWMDGALGSGIRAAEEVERRLA